MTVVVITLAIVLAGAVAGLIAMAVSLKNAKADQARDNEKHLDERIALNELANTYKSERDQFSIGNAQHVKRIGELEQMLRTASADRDDAVKKAIESKAEEIRNGKTDADAASAFSSVFSEPILPEAGNPGSGHSRR